MKIRNIDEPIGDYAFNLLTPFLFMITIAFILIWGGIFWW